MGDTSTGDDGDPDRSPWLRAARVAAFVVSVSCACAVVLVAIALQGLFDRPDRRPPFGWVAAGAGGCALIGLAFSKAVLRARDSGRSAVRLARRILLPASIVSVVTTVFTYYVIVAFVYSGD